MTNKPFSRRTKFVSQKRWLYKAGSRENTKIFLRGDTLRKWCITRPVGRVRIETRLFSRIGRLSNIIPQTEFCN